MLLSLLCIFPFYNVVNRRLRRMSENGSEALLAIQRVLVEGEHTLEKENERYFIFL